MNVPEPDRCALVIEDDEDIRSLIEFTLSSHGFEVETCEDGSQAVEAARRTDPDLITLDLGLPGLDGIEVCRRLREITDAYIVIISARDEEIDRLLGLETGADDYLPKPFSPRELRARVNAMLRRPRHPSEASLSPSPASSEAGGRHRKEHEQLAHGPILVDVDARRAWVADEEVTLTRTEFDLLVELLRSPARVWTREQLLRSVWGTEWASDTHLVEVHVGNLRRKLGERRTGPRYVRTVRGVGYRMEDQAASR